MAKRVRLVGLDVDGVMTDAGVYIGMGDGGITELKRFDIQDTVGVHLLQVARIKVVIVSGRYSEATNIRARELGIDEVVQDPKARKLPAFQEMLDRLGIRMEEAAFVGDDLPDLPVLSRVGLPVAVQNARPEVREIAAYVTGKPGGQGAVRDFVEALLHARGEWEDVVRRYLAERGDPTLRSSGAH
jgi:3-deoxy-D-manno-octulosonate 8-phosphate phosphatase (KDO 8-P phosphatase)